MFSPATSLARGARVAPEGASEPLVAALGALNADQTLGRYELLAPLGSGGMAVVWSARLRGTRGFSKVVAVKTIRPALASDPQLEQALLGEAEIASRIEHPNVCQILDLGEERGVVYLVMEYIDGDPLTALLGAAGAGAHVDYGVAAYLAAQAARGLCAAHELQSDGGALAGVIHRDVSPQNILVTCRGLVKVVDFGLAKAALRSGPATETGVIKGKVAYLAPEHVRGEAVDGRADIFGLGVVLQELTTGRNPLRRATDLGTLLSISSADPVTAPSAPDFPASLRHILETALAKDPGDRYPSMRELAADLEASSAALGATPESVSEYVTRALGARRDERARDLRAAVAAADARLRRRAAGGRAPVVPSTAEDRPPVEREDPPALQPSQGPRRARRRAVGALVVGLAGVGLGALGVGISPRIAGDRDAAAEARSPAAPAAEASTAAAPPAEVGTGSDAPASSSSPEPAMAAIAAPPATSSASPRRSGHPPGRVAARAPEGSPSASAAESSPSASVPSPGRAGGVPGEVPTAAAAASSSAGARFRRPGF